MKTLHLVCDYDSFRIVKADEHLNVETVYQSSDLTDVLRGAVRELGFAIDIEMKRVGPPDDEARIPIKLMRSI